MDSKALLDRIYNNIDYLILINGYERSEVEKSIGVSVGYISRLRTHNVDLPITKIVAIASFFKIRVENLLAHNYEKDYLNMQMDKLKSRLQEIS